MARYFEPRTQEVIVSWIVTTRPDADADLIEARDWYDLQRAGLGDEFLAAVAAALIRLEESPELFAIYYNGFRRVLIDVFPYKIFFRIEGKNVIVFRILHAAREHTWRL